jgi:hypothetical protein
MSVHEVQDREKIRAAAPDADNETDDEGTDILEDKSEGSVSSEGYRVCGFIIEE